MLKRVTFLALATLPVLAACSSAGPVDASSVSEEAVTSSTRTFLVPVDERARTLCRDEVNAYYCDANAARAAIHACRAKIGATSWLDACSSDDPRCIRTENYGEPCVGTKDPVYPTVASCTTPRPLNCSFYSACVERETPCGEQGYALGYGEKYCTAFKNINGLSTTGVAWRDSVMHCLQEELVPESQPTSIATCDEIIDTAFASHPVCYTQPEHSICFLPPTDTLNILSTIGGSELLTARSRKQIITTIGACIGQIGHAIFSFGARTESAPMTLESLHENERFWRQLEQEYKASEIQE